MGWFRKYLHIEKLKDISMHWVLAVDDSCPTQNKNPSVPQPPGATKGLFHWLQLLPLWRAWPFLLSTALPTCSQLLLPTLQASPISMSTEGAVAGPFFLWRSFLHPAVFLPGSYLSLCFLFFFPSRVHFFPPLLKCARLLYSRYSKLSYEKTTFRCLITPSLGGKSYRNLLLD